MTTDTIVQHITGLADNGGGCVLRSESGREWHVRTVTREGDALVVRGTEERCQYAGSTPPEFEHPLAFFVDYVAITGLAITVEPAGETP